jgi:hypothetical protein
VGIFKKAFGRKAARSFDDVRYMRTRRLPVPGLNDPDKYFIFEAKRGDDGYWKVEGKHNLRNVTSGVEDVSKAFADVFRKHAGQRSALLASYIFNFDAAFMILREMEEAVLAHNGDAAPTPEPDHHFMAAYRLLPQAFRTTLDETYFRGLREKGPVLAPKKPAAENKPASPDAPPPKGPRPN